MSYSFSSKLLSLEEAEKKSREFREEGKRIVTVNGSYDLFHFGHLNVLEQAKKQGDVLFVGVNSDASVQSGKEPDRPFIKEQERSSIVAALMCTDYVSIIEGHYNEAQNTFLRAIKPHVHVNDGAYGAPEEWLEWSVLQELGTEPYACPRTAGISTSDLLERLKNDPTS